MKKLIALFLLFTFCRVSAQEIDPNIPKVIPPSPTVSALMKFEEYPVNNYTGIPDISIPIYDVVTADKKLKVNVSLKYHPAAAAASERVGNVGLGWSLLAGGSISRTVRGLPDEYLLSNKFGINNPNSIFYRAFMGEPFNGNVQEAKNEFAFDALQSGKYDTEFDLYQYNFFGYTGRFILDKHNQVKKLDINNLKIRYEEHEGAFVIIDENGYEYWFSTQETSTNTTLSELVYWNNERDNPNDYVHQYVSAWHLTTVLNNIGTMLVSLNYSNPEEEKTTTGTSTSTELRHLAITDVMAYIRSDCPNAEQQIKTLQPRLSTNTITTATQTRKLTSIDIKDVARIDFTNSSGRVDYRLRGDGLTTLTHIKINKKQDTAYVPYKYFNLRYMLSPVPGRIRSLLKSVEQGSYTNDTPNQETLNYTLEYDKYFQELNYSTEDEFGLDYWGYYTGKLGGNEKNKEASKTLCTSEMLQKITLPTGGATIFNFESNTYAGEPNPLTDFNDNPDNWISTNYTVSHSGHTVQERYFLLEANQIRIIKIKASTSNSHIRLYGQRVNQSNWTPLGLSDSGETTLKFIQNTGDPNDCTAYKYQYEVLNTGVSNAEVFITESIRIWPLYEWLYGGGVRIKNIGYFNDRNVDRNYYKSTQLTQDQNDSGYFPSKEKTYSYNYFNNSRRSSGYLVTPKPIFEYFAVRKAGLMCLHETPAYYEYKFITGQGSTRNTTNGSFVGYENVTVSETGNGKSQYTYTTSHSVNDDVQTYNTSYPFIPLSTFDYKKGLLLLEEIFDESNNKLKKTEYTYPPEYEINKEEITGIKVYNPVEGDCPKSRGISYVDYVVYLSQCGVSPLGAICVSLCGPIENFMQYTILKERFGICRLKSKFTTEYFYDAASSQPKLVQQKEDYTYNDVNNKISTIKKYLNTGANSDCLTTEYDYYFTPDYLATNRIADIKEIREFRNQKMISKKNINYNTTFPYFPATISTSKGTANLEERLKFTAYDYYGHILEVKKTDGITYSYIWGYSKTEPIAMIENATNAQVAAALNVSSIDRLSEADLTAINNLRTLLPQAKVTTLTYEPLVGVKTMTDPRGYTTSYEYDAFGRLVQVKDQDNNIISENKYHYKN